MFDIQGIEYPMQYANYQRNSRVPVSTTAAGKLKWTQAFSDANENFQLTPRAVLINGTVVGVLSTDNLLLYDTGGAYDEMVPLGTATPVIFGGKAIAYLEPAFLLNYRDYHKKQILESGEFPAVDQWAYALLLKPGPLDFLAVVQSTGGPHPAPPPEFDIFRKEIKKSRMELHQNGNGTLKAALLTTDSQHLVTVLGKTVQLWDAARITPASQFDLDFDTIESVSLSPDNALVIVGHGAMNKGDRPYLAVYGPDGKQKWLYLLRGPQTAFPPVCGGKGQVYIVAENKLQCIAAGKLLWACPLDGSGDVLMTVTANDDVLMVRKNRLTRVDVSGNAQFSIEITEAAEYFDAPPSVDASGRIYVASDKNLYCFE